MAKTVTVIKQNQTHVTEIFKDGIKTEIVFRQLYKDPRGKSGSSPTWGMAYYNKNGKLKFNGIALYKEFDYDLPLAAYGEKVWSILGNEILEKSIRVPKIDIVEQIPGYEEIISYIVLDNDKEDLIHIKDILYNKFEREEIKQKREIYTIDEILECIKLEIEDEKKYKKIEKDIIQVLVLDAITNNGDRHSNNWGIIRNKQTNEYNLAVFDHASSFVNMFQNNSYYRNNNEWVGSYTTVGRDKGNNHIGSNGKNMIDYIAKEYPEYFNEFCDKFNSKLTEILSQIKEEKIKIDYSRLEQKMNERKGYLKQIKNREEYEYV